MSRLEKAMSPAALIISVLALLVATSAGSAYAAAKISTSQIKNNAITTPKIKNNAVTGAKIKNNAIAAAKIKNNALTGAKIQNGAITGAKVQDRSITTNDLAPTTVAALSGTKTYWAYVTQAGAVGRGSSGVSAEAQLNSGFWQYRVTFPRNVSGCGYSVSSGDNAVIGSNEFVAPARIAVARSSQGPNVLAVNVYDFASGNSIQDTFFIAVHC